MQCHTHRQHTVIKVHLQPSHLNAYYSLDSSKTSHKTRDLGLEDLKNKNSFKLNNENVIMFILYQESQ